MKRLFISSTLILFIISCGEKVREVITERYDNGQKKVLEFYRGEGSSEEIIKSILYFENGQKRGEGTFKDGNVISTKEWYEDGSVME